MGADTFENESDWLRLLADTVSDVFWVADPEIQNTLYVSPAYDSVWQSTRETLKTNPRSFVDQVHPEDRNKLLNAMLEQRKGNPFSHEYRLLLPDGGVRWIWDAGAPVKDEHGNVKVYAGVAKDITERKRIESELFESRQRLQEINLRREAIREEETRRIAREIHDELGQRLTALKMGISALRLSPPESLFLDSSLASLQAQIDDAIASMRHLSANLRPASLDLGLLPALRWLTNNFSQISGIPCAFEASLPALPLPDFLATQIYRIVQESLTNIARHAEAHQARVVLEVEDDFINLGIEDNGHGFDVPAVMLSTTHNGLRGIRERIAMLGGTIRLDSEPGKGASIACFIPLAVDGGSR